MKTVPIMAAIAVAAAPAIAAVQTDIFATLVARADALNRDSGYRATGWQHRGTLRGRGAETVKVRLAGEQPVRIVGMCDGDCDDLNLELLDAAGKSIARDVQGDGFPIVAAETGGGYSLRVSMPGCATATCTYVVRAYAERP